MSATDPGHQYFISYSRRDSDFVTQFASDLRQSGIDVWIDTRDINAGTQWDDVIEAALRAAVGIIVVVSPASMESDFVKKEIIFAQNNKKSIFPVLAEEAEIPLLLADWQIVDFSKDYSTGFEQLAESLRKSSAKTVTESQTPWHRFGLRNFGNFSLKRTLIGLPIGAVYGVAITLALNLSGGGMGAMTEGFVVYGVVGALAALITPRSYRALTLFTSGFLVSVIVLWVWTNVLGEKSFDHVLVVGPIVGGVAGALFSRIVVSLR